MKVKSFFTFATSAVLLSGALSGCSSDTITSETQLPADYRDIKFSPALAAVAESQNDFSAKFFSEIAELEADSTRNLMVSPLSAGMGLSMLANTVDNATSSDLLNLLGQSDLDALNSYNATLLKSLPVANGSTTLSLANMVWVTDRVSIPESYTMMFYETFGDYPAALNFSNKDKAQKVIDSWCADRTQGLIKNICTDNVTNMQIMFANALYFTSTWDKPFDSDETKTEPFTTTSGIKKVPMMNGEFVVDALDIPGASSIKLYFHDKRYAITLILPDDGESAIDLAKDTNRLKSILTSDYGMKLYKLKIPKFSVGGYFKMYNYINEFIPGFFDGMWDKCGLNTPLRDYTLVQHTKFIVNEKGAEVAAVTNTEWLSGIGGKTNKFYLDRPFIFAVTEVETGTVILTGIINDPTLEDSGFKV